jgi:alkylhydroperoxidase family enzyme
MSAVSGLPGLPASARETAILAIGSQYQAPYEIYAHERVVLKNTFLTKEQINAVKKGREAGGLGEGGECGV